RAILGVPARSIPLSGAEGDIPIGPVRATVFGPGNGRRISVDIEERRCSRLQGGTGAGPRLAAGMEYVVETQADAARRRGCGLSSGRDGLDSSERLKRRGWG